MKRFYTVIFFIVCISLIQTPVCSLAHPGNTDSNGGHYNSSTGKYHYHHGYPAHQHPDGICPYTDTRSSTDGLITNNSSTVIKEPENIEKTGISVEQMIVIVTGILFFGFVGVRTYTSSLHDKITSLQSRLSSVPDASNVVVSPTIIEDYNHLKRDYDTLQEKYVLSVNSNSQPMPYAEYNELKTQYNTLYENHALICNNNSVLAHQLTEANKKLMHYEHLLNSEKLQQDHYISKIQAITIENEALKSDIFDLEQNIHNLELIQKDWRNCNNPELMTAAKVPYGVTFDSNLLPHYYCNNIVEKNLHVFISDNSKCYHRKKGCSGAYSPIHLFSVADHMIPCQRCIPFSAQNYKVPSWYHCYLKLLRHPDLASENIENVRYQLSEHAIDGIDELKF